MLASETRTEREPNPLADIGGQETCRAETGRPARIRLAVSYAERETEAQATAQSEPIMRWFGYCRF
jgi:hypothetical protein